MQKRVLLGMSGGIDSSVSAMILKEQGYEVVGLTLRLWDKHHKEDVEPDYIQKAQLLAKQLNMEHHISDVRNEFRQKVIGYFVSDYQKGRTPNACVYCNPEIKWGTLQSYASVLKCDFIATGHYVQKIKIDDMWYLKKGIDPAKDQSYFLWNLRQEALEKTIFPLGGFTKQHIREYAIRQGFKVLDKQKESMGVCFLQNKDYRDFLKNAFEAKDIIIPKGMILNENGENIGSHDGIPFYTIGQKRGLNLTVDKSYYVSELRANQNKIVVGEKQSLMKTILWVEDYHLVDKNVLHSEVEITTLIRGFGQNPQGPSSFDIIDNKNLKVTLSDYAWAPASGQPVAFYHGEVLIGGGILKAAE